MDKKAMTIKWSGHLFGHFHEIGISAGKIHNCRSGDEAGADGLLRLLQAVYEENDWYACHDSRKHVPNSW